MIRNAIQRFMYGRYGNDQLNVGLMVLYLVLYLLYWLTGADLLYWVSMVVLFTALFRLLSRSHAKRRAENAKFLQALVPLLKWYRLRRTIRQDKEHCYFKCPNCGQQLRVPGARARSPSPAGAAAPPLRKRADPRAPFRPAAGGSPTLGSASGFFAVFPAKYRVWPQSLFQFRTSYGILLKSVSGRRPDLF